MTQHLQGGQRENNLTEAAQLLRRAAALLEQSAQYSDRARQRPRSGSTPAAIPPSDAPPVDDRLTSRQLGAIFAIARRHGLARDRLLNLVRQRTGRQRVEHLTREDASALIAELDASAGASA